MFLSAKSIRNSLKDYDLRILIGDDNIDPEQRFEGSKIELTLGDVYEINRGRLPSVIGVKSRLIQEGKPIRPREPVHNPYVSMDNPYWPLGEGVYLLQTRETVIMPIDKIGVIQQRTSIFRSGCSIQNSFIDPGFNGRITVGLNVPPDVNIEIEQGSGILNLWLTQIMTWAGYGNGNRYLPAYPDETDPYQGIWSGDKTTTDGKVERGK